MGRHASARERSRRRVRPALVGAAGIVAAALVAGVAIVGASPSRTVVRGAAILAPDTPPRGTGPDTTPDTTPGGASVGEPATAGPPLTASGNTAQARPARPGTPPGGASAGGGTDITVAFAGDVHFTGRTAGRVDAGADALGPLGAALAAADLSMVNLDTAITERGTPAVPDFHFRAPPTALDALRSAGIDVVTMANSHAVDYGATGLADTLAAIGGHHLPVVGVGADASRAYTPWYTTVRGTRFAVLGADQVRDRTLSTWTAGTSSPGVASAYSSRLLDAVRQARQNAQVVVVYLHWGNEGQECPSTTQANLARQLAEAGADAVVGSHAHQLMGSGWLGSTYVGYGLGNFLWWRDNAMSNDTGVLTLTFRGGHVVRAALTPARIDAHGVPQPAVGSSADRILATARRAAACAGLTNHPG